MAVSYNRLWKLMIDRGIKKKKDLCSLAGISTASVTKMGKDGHVTTAVLCKICKALHCDFKDIISYEPDNADDYICPECGEKLEVMWATRDGATGVYEIVAACFHCYNDWRWNEDPDGSVHEKERFFHG